MLDMLLFMGLGGAELMLIALIIIGMVIWALVDVLRSDFVKPNNKIVWIILIVFMPVLGSFLYILIGRNQRAAKRY